MTERQKALDRVKKLLALANRPGTPEEGEAALSRAQALAEKHGFRIGKNLGRRRTTTRTTTSSSSSTSWVDDLFRSSQAAQAQARAAARAGEQARRARAHQQREDDEFLNGRRVTPKERTEARRKRTTYRRAYDRGYLAFECAQLLSDNPYDKHVWGVNLPGAWCTGWYDARDKGVRNNTTPYDQEADS